MANPYIGEIRLFAGNYAPAGWNFCDGSLIPIGENSTLFQLIGTTYGGDGQQTFAVPDMRSRVPVHFGNLPGGGSYQMGQRGGIESVTLLTPNLPAHTHQMFSSTTGSALSPQTNLPSVASVSGGIPHAYGPAGSSTNTLNPSSLLPDGHSLAHNNMQPFLAVSFIISLFGIFPTQS